MRRKPPRPGPSRLALAGVLALFGSAGAMAQAPVRGGPLPEPLPLFPATNWWNQDVSQAPVDPNSAAFIQFIGPTRGLHPDFGGDASPAPSIYGMVYMTVPGDQVLEPVAFDYADESDVGAPGRPAGYPIPSAAKTQSKWIEGGYPGNAAVSGDKHMLIVDRDNRLLFETWDTRCLPAGSSTCSWRAGSGAIFDLDSNARRPDGWTSADAAGLAILPGLVRYDEVFSSGPIRHAFRFTVRATNGYVYPASHRAGSTAGALPMGARLRLKAGKDISGYSAPLQRIFEAMKTYGLIVADNGSDMYVQGAYDTRWDNGALNPAFDSLEAGDFDVVELGWRGGSGPIAGPLSFFPIVPCRVLDTREAPGPNGGPSFTPAERRTVGVAGHCGIPLAARAVTGNLAVVAPASSGEVGFSPGDRTPGVASAVRFSAGQTRASAIVLALATTGDGTVVLENRSAAGSTHVLLDVSGYFQ